MTYINRNVKVTVKEAHDLLMLHKNHHLWNTPFWQWTASDYENLKLGINKSSHKRHIRYQKVKVVLKNGKEKEYASIKSVSNVFKISQSTVSNILAGRKGTDKFLSIQKI